MRSSNPQNENDDPKLLLSKFILELRHDLRAPFDSIIGIPKYMLLEERYGPLTELQRLDLKLVYENGKNLLRRINNIFEVARIEANDLELIFRQIDVGRLLDKLTTKLISRELAEDDRQMSIQGINEWATELVRNLREQVEFRMDIPKNLPVVWADVRLTQIVFEIMRNAIVFTNKGTITLVASKYKENIRIEVRNTGRGLPEFILRELAQVKSSGSLYAAPNGIELALSRKWVELHGGKMEIESQEAIGTNITVTIPIDKNKTVYYVKKMKKGQTFGVYYRNIKDEEKPLNTGVTWQKANELKNSLENSTYPADKP